MVTDVIQQHWRQPALKMSNSRLSRSRQFVSI